MTGADTGGPRRPVRDSVEVLHEEEQMDHAAPDSQGTWAQVCPLADDASPADHHRFAAAASGFMGALLEDPRVTALQAAWRADMESLWLRIAKSLVRGAGSGQVHAPLRPVEQAMRFVKQDLRIPWPWVAFTLMLDGGFDVFTDLTGQTVPDRTFHARELVLAPPLVLLPIRGESTEEQRERLEEAWHRLEVHEREVREASSLEASRAPKNQGAFLQWLYEADYRVPKRSHAELGRTLVAHGDKAHTGVCDCYKVIGRGIKEARRLFDLCSVTWDTLRATTTVRPAKRRRARTSARRRKRPRDR
jgi:hypothetical protein